MAAILDSLGFTFLIDRMTEVLTPDIYIELTGPDTPDAIRQRDAIFLFLKVNKTVNESKFERYVDQITQNVIALLNIWKI
jgi:hypothetical protein